MDSGLVHTVSGEQDLPVLTRRRREWPCWPGQRCRLQCSRSRGVLDQRPQPLPGVVTLTQNNSVVHNDPNDPVGRPASRRRGRSAVRAKLTATITDGDGDTDSGLTRDIGNAFKFEDDGPNPSIRRRRWCRRLRRMTPVRSPTATAQRALRVCSPTRPSARTASRDADDNNVEDADAISYVLKRGGAGGRQRSCGHHLR